MKRAVFTPHTRVFSLLRFDSLTCSTAWKTERHWMTYGFLGVGNDVILTQRKFDVICFTHTDLRSKQWYSDHVKLHWAAMLVTIILYGTVHWKLLHNIYPTNNLLFKMGVKDSIRCSYCADNDYIEHFFVLRVLAALAGVQGQRPGGGCREAKQPRTFFCCWHFMHF